MQTVDNIHELDYIYPKILILQLIEKTKDCAVIWDKMSPTAYKTKFSIDDRYYDINLTYLRSTYIIDFVRNGRFVINVDAASVPELIDLFKVIDLFWFQNADILQSVQNQTSCS